MVVMGIVPSDRDSLGLDAAGVVTRVGATVDHLKVGNRVFISSTGLLTTHKLTVAKGVVRFAEC
jgi:NADPH:quinone reductase-like Zn-dependent oxidoreductase